MVNQETCEHSFTPLLCFQWCFKCDLMKEDEALDLAFIRHIIKRKSGSDIIQNGSEFIEVKRD